jgi:hypothetical protein
MPDVIRVVASIPRSSTGKIKRNQFAEILDVAEIVVTDEVVGGGGGGDKAEQIKQCIEAVTGFPCSDDDTLGSLGIDSLGRIRLNKLIRQVQSDPFLCLILLFSYYMEGCMESCMRD